MGVLEMDDYTNPLAEFSAEERSSAKRTVMQAVHRSGMIATFGAVAPDGTKPIIVAFEDEPIGEIVKKAGWTDGFANVVVLMDGNSSIAVLALTPGNSGVVYATVNAKHLNLSVDSHIGMVVHAAQLEREAIPIMFFDYGNADVKHSESLSSKELIPA